MTNLNEAMRQDRPKETPAPHEAKEPALAMRDQIKSVAVEMLTRYGYRGFRFHQVSGRLNITRASVHYHFGNKSKIAEQVIQQYCDELIASLTAIWATDLNLFEKINNTMLLNRRRYLKFNPSGRTANPWSLIARMRLERDTLSVKSNEVLSDFIVQLEALITEGVRASVRHGELRAEAPVEKIAFHIVSLCSSSDPITQDAGTFERLEQLYRSFYEIIEHAYGVHSTRPAN
jgi:TetR/AcrR family transcriptional regulator, transcriptional repressor for nem operon